MASSVDWIPSTAGCRVASLDKNKDNGCSGSNSELRLAGEDGVGRLKLVFKGEEAGDSEGLTFPGVGVSLRLKSFPKNSLAPLGVF